MDGFRGHVTQFCYCLQPPDEEREGEGAETAEEETIVYKYVPPEPKDWVSQGSEKEIQEESVIEMRRRVCKMGPSCSKLTTWLGNVSLKFQMLISEKCQNLLLKKCEKLLQCKSFSHLFNKKISVFG